jgi:hypothetical protein
MITRNSNHKCLKNQHPGYVVNCMFRYYQFFYVRQSTLGLIMHHKGNKRNRFKKRGSFFERVLNADLHRNSMQKRHMLVGGILTWIQYPEQVIFKRLLK